jgi:hypothetical protein
MARKLKDKDLQKYGSRMSAVKMATDKPSPAPMKGLDKGLDEAVSKIGAKTKQGMSDAGSFGSAFKAARSSGDKTFTWHGKSFTTDTASGKRAAPAAPTKRAAPAAKAPTSGQKGFGGKAPSFMDKPASRSAGPMKAGFKSAMGPSASSDFSKARVPSSLNPANKSAPAKKRPLFGEDGIIAGYDSPATAAKKAAEGKAKAKAGNPFYKSYLDKPGGMKKGGSVKKFAKGGSIDGCAIRGKTKAR